MNRKLITIVAAGFLSLAVRVLADDTTPRMGLTVPSIGSSGYAPKINNDLVKIDSMTAVLNQSNGFTGTNTFTGTTNLNGTLTLISPLSTLYGGTGQNWSAVTIGRIPYFSGTGAMSTLAAGTTGYLFRSGGNAAPSWIDPLSLSVSYAATAGNASTVTNGVYTSGSYADPTWLTGLAWTKISGAIPWVSTTSTYADPSWLTSLAGSKITGYVSSSTYADSAGSVTNGVYTTGSYANPSWITSLAGSKISGGIPLADTATYATNAGGIIASGAPTSRAYYLGTEDFMVDVNGLNLFNINPTAAVLSYGVPFYASTGSVAAPEYSFDNDSTSGFHLPIPGQIDLSIGGSKLTSFNSSGQVFGDDEGYLLDKFPDSGFLVPNGWTEVDANGVQWQNVSDGIASFYTDEGATGRTLIYREVPAIRSMTVTATEQSDVDAYSLTKACAGIPTIASEESGCITAKFYFPSSGTDPDVGGDCDGQYKLLQLFDGTSNVGYACGDHPGVNVPHTIKVAAENGTLTADVDNGTWSVSSTTALSTFDYGAIGGRQMVEFSGFTFQNATFGTDRDYLKLSASTLLSNNTLKVKSRSPSWTVLGTEVGPFSGLVGENVAFTIAETSISRTFVDLSALNISYINGYTFAFDDNTYVHEGSVLRQGAYTATIDTRLLNGYWQVSDPTGFITGAATISDFSDPDNATADEVAQTITGAIQNPIYGVPRVADYMSWYNDGFDHVYGSGSLFVFSVGIGTANSILGFQPTDPLPKMSIQVTDDPSTGFVMSKPNQNSYDGMSGIVGGRPWMNATSGGGLTLIGNQTITMDAENTTFGPAGNEVASFFYGLDNGQIGVTLGGNPAPGAVGQAMLAINGMGSLAYDSGTGNVGIQWGTIGNGNGARSYTDFTNSSYLAHQHRFIVGNTAGDGVVISTSEINNPFYQTPGAMLDVRGGVVVGEPTGGDKGYGAINVAGDLYKNGKSFTPIYGSSETANDSISVASTNYVGISTVTMTLRGGMPLRFDHYEIISNGSGAARNYTIAVAIDGVSEDPHLHTNSGLSTTSDNTFYFNPSGLSSGSHTFSVWIKSSSATGTQTVTDYHLLVREGP